MASWSSNSTRILQAVFWSVVFVLNVGPEWHRYGSFREVLEVAGTTTLLQGLVALVAIRYLAPRWLDRGLTVAFGLLTFLVLLVAAEVNVLVSYIYLEPTYLETYGKYYQSLDHLNLLQRMGLSYMIKYIVFSKLPTLFFPAAILLAVNYYRKQQAVMALREQKRVAELNALKSQLNPHFIFNTLNNIYALAIKKSERTAEAVEKLSGILDYVLYRCNDEYVSLNDEIEMIEDYIALEQLRFGDRLEVSFKNEIESSTKIAPLLFLTLIENAFKHSATQELKRAFVNLRLSSYENNIEFEVSNTKPQAAMQDDREGIGLMNLRRQLNLLYPNAHRLDIVDSGHNFSAKLTLGST